ncbi:hypothetical protein Plhal304r1_c001g0000071 [Plasmopara halstedii]
MWKLPFKISDDPKTMQAILLSAVDTLELTAEAAHNAGGVHSSYSFTTAFQSGFNMMSYLVKVLWC